MNLATSKGFAYVVILALVLSPVAFAQIHGSAPSVTSIGFGGSDNPTPGVPASVTSLGQNGYQGHSHFSTTPSGDRGPHHPGRPTSGGYFYPGYIPVYSVPYSIIDQPVGDIAPELPQEEYRGGPTIFDRRGPGPSRVSPSNYSDEERREPPKPVDEAMASPLAASPEPDRPKTALIFKDGHQLEVQNYAIVGETLYDLTSSHRRKVALSELDIKATQRENDERGIDFRLPPNGQAE